MNKFLFLLVNLACLSQLNAMNKAAERATQLVIDNETNDKIRVVYQLNYNEVPHNLDIAPKTKKSLPDWKQLKKLVIGAYGQWKSIANAAVLGLRATDYTFDILKQAQSKPESDLALVVKSGVSEEGTFGSKGLLSATRGVVEFFTPYTVQILTVSPEEIPSEVALLPVSRVLADSVPMVKQAIEQKKEILPRYFIEVGEGATVNDIEREHARLVKAWTPIATGPNPQDAKYAQDLLKGIELAYTILKAEAQFKDFLNKNIYMFSAYPK